ncbi:MAG TPA: FAD-binding oxidoreductase [Gammaproteobacteria bacterium]|nr:FAD-binding oxidoreductase [Gammaproteobacteria bacterium]
MHPEAALEQIAAVVGPAGILAPADAGGLLSDHRELLQGSAALVVRPASAEECARVLRLCNAARIGVVPQGGNTGLCGGATPFDRPARREILLSTARMNAVREVDTVGFTLTAEAGVVLAAAQEAARGHDLLLPLSMGSEGSATLGGALSTNAGGIAVLRYGTMRDLVLGLEVVLPSGGVLRELKGLRKDNTGYDLRALFLGAEGTLGVVTTAVLKLFPRPRSRETAWLAVASVDAACRVLGRARRATGDAVVSAEYVARGALDLVLAHVPGARDPFAARHAHHLLLELASADPDGGLRTQLERVLADGLEAGEIVDGVVAESGAQRDALWRLRERVPEAERRAGGSVKHDVAVRISRIPDLVALAEREVAAIAPCRPSVFGHVGDGNLHFNVLPPAGQTLADLGAGTIAALTACVHEAAMRLGGTFSAEHGVGFTKTGDLARYEAPEALALMRALKQTIDPHGIMNPGKVLGA